jgi:hypothetical protein
MKKAQFDSETGRYPVLTLALVVAREVNGRPALQCQFRHAAHLSAIVHATGILTEGRFLSIWAWH